MALATQKLPCNLCNQPRTQELELSRVTGGYEAKGSLDLV
uniref:Uncharacterized protein n=1 Tax=Arundo donax TaxID=35708 RepID=A0A0A9B945_ARUDO